jgi:surface antigen
MLRLASIAALTAAALLTGCARLDSLGPSAFASTADTPETTASATPTEQFASSTILLFLDPTAAEKMSDKEKAEAASAQYYALQFGRPGAPRQWQGDVSASGEVTVGPFVRVNELDCRDFSHLVKIGETSYPRSGTACREAGGEWVVVASN